MELLKRFKNELIAIALIIIFAAAMKGLFSYHNGKMRELDSKKKEVEKNKILVAAWERANKEYQALKKDFLPITDITLENYVKDKAKNYNISIRDKDFNTASKEDGDGLYIVTTVTSSGEAGYKNIINFVKALDETKIDINKLYIKALLNTREFSLNFSGIILKDSDEDFVKAQASAKAKPKKGSKPRPETGVKTKSKAK